MAKKSSAKHIQTNATLFRKINAASSVYDAKGRTKSAALLLWFLENIFRIDDTDAQDAVCDNSLDEGIDAIVVLDEQQEIVVFQAKRKEKLPSTLGDTELRHFVGSMTSFRQADSVSEIEKKTKNADLRRLITDHKIARKITDGYSLRGVFVANVSANNEALRYIRNAENDGIIIDLWDLARIGPVLKQLEREWFVDDEIKLRLATGKFFVQGKKTVPDLVFSAVPVKELVKISGIDDTRVFAQNVRLDLGRTRVNRDISASVKDSAEHKKFLTYHNGLTIVAKEIKVRGTVLTMNHYSICNGCQSLRTFYANREDLTNGLEVLVRFVKVGDDRSLADSIAYRTNNQNPISLRDLSANDATQLQIKSDFDKDFGWDSTYSIKRGEPANAEVLPNESAGQILLSLYVGEPWSAHQKYKVFGEFRRRIFRYGIDANHIRLAQLIFQVSQSALDGMENERIRRYTLTRYIVLYLIGEVLRQEKDGQVLLDSPAEYLEKSDGNGRTTQKAIFGLINGIAREVVTEFSFYVNEQGEAYDYKSKFKSEKEVKRIRTEVVKNYVKDKGRGKALVFKLPKKTKK